jgi:hypothetical protein
VLGEFVPFRLLLGAEVGAVEQLLQAEDLDFFLGGGGDQVLVLVDHLLLDLREGVFLGRPFTFSLNQTAAHDA